MKYIGEEAYLNPETGELFIQEYGDNEELKPLRATGFTFEDTPTYGWPLSIMYPNRPLQFATEDTTQKVRRLLGNALQGYKLRFEVTLDVVKVGPFSRAPIRQIAVHDAEGLIVKWNAGLLASEFARFPARWEMQRKSALLTAYVKRDSEQES